jgi:WD40 repeat protein
VYLKASQLFADQLTLLRTIRGDIGFVWSVALSADGRTLVSGGEDIRIKIWDMQTGKELGTLTGHTSTVFSVALSADGQTLVSGSSDGTIKIWGKL